MAWQPIDNAPRNGKIIKVRDEERLTAFWARYWTRESLKEWGDDYRPGWYEHHPNAEYEDGDEVYPIAWDDE